MDALYCCFFVTSACALVLVESVTTTILYCTQQALPGPPTTPTFSILLTWQNVEVIAVIIYVCECVCANVHMHVDVCVCAYATVCVLASMCL